MTKRKGRRGAVVARVVEGVGTKLASAGRDVRRLAEQRFGSKAFRVADSAVDEVRRRLAPSVAKLHDWCEAAPPAPKDRAAAADESAAPR